MPGVAIGHNDRVAWGMTAFDADTADLYVERMNPENSHQVEVDGRWQNTTVVDRFAAGERPRRNRRRSNANTRRTAS